MGRGLPFTIKAPDYFHDLPVKEKGFLLLIGMIMKLSKSNIKKSFKLAACLVASGLAGAGIGTLVFGPQREQAAYVTTVIICGVFSALGGAIAASDRKDKKLIALACVCSFALLSHLSQNITPFVWGGSALSGAMLSKALRPLWNRSTQPDDQGPK